MATFKNLQCMFIILFFTVAPHLKPLFTFSCHVLHQVTWAVFADLAWTHLQSLFQDKEFDEENDANPWYVCAALHACICTRVHVKD
jgi:hypothetical protein